MMAVSASASVVSYTTSGTFVSSGTNTLTGTGTGGATGSIVFTGNTTSNAGTPSNINLGDFLDSCTGCSTTASGSAYLTYSGFTFDLVVDDTTSGGIGHFVGTSGGGTVFSDSASLSLDITWGSFIVDSGTFGTVVFGVYTPTPIVAQNSGTPPGDSTVSGFVNDTSVPEPATLSLIGGALLGLGVLGRKKFFRP
jgi:hypothetical protein